MYSIFNRISWILAILAFLIIFLVDDDLFLFGLIVFVIIKVLFNKTFIENSLSKFKENISNEIIEKLKLSGVKIPKKISENIIKENEKKEILESVLNETKSEIVGVKKIDDDFYDEDYYTRLEKEKNNNILLQGNIDKIENKNDSINEIREEKLEEPSKIAKFLSDFFAENLMAKIGGILLALGVIFLMSLVYTYVGPVAKILIGFVIGFTVYFVGVFVHNKGYDTEGTILIGTGILINYIVILSGKFIIGNGFLDSYLTFILLILNTIFSVVTSFVYSSKNLLLFSIIFSYIIPFIIGENYNTPFLLVGYSLILSIGGLFLSNYFYKVGDNLTSIQLFYTTLIGGNILFLIAPFGNDSSYFVSKMIGFNVINFASIFLLYKNKQVKNIMLSFIITYIFLAFIMFSGYALTGLGVMIMFIIATLGLLIINSFFIITSIGVGLLNLIFLPLLFVLFFLFLGASGTGIILIPLFLLAYLLVFAFGIGSIVSSIFKYIFFVILGVFLFLANLHLNIDFGIDKASFLTIFITSFIYFFTTYFLSTKKDLSYLYTLGTFSTIVLLLSIIEVKGEFSFLSIIGITLFGISNYLLPFVNKNLIKNDSTNLIFGIILGVLFVGGNLFRFGNEYFPGVSLGIAFLGLAILYFIGGFLIFSRLDKEEIKNDSNLNLLYAFLAIAVSLFSISVALVFSKLPLVISIIWLFESTILFYFANKLNKEKIYLAGIILFIIGLVKYMDASLNGISLNYSDLVSIGIISILLFLNIKLPSKDAIFTKVLHIFGIFIVFVNLVTIFDFKDYGNFLIFTLFFTTFIGVIYDLFKDKILSYFSQALLVGLLLVHIISTNFFDNYNLNYIFTILSLSIVYLQSRFFEIKYKYMNIISGIYFFIISSIYLFNFTNDYFSLTIYWGILSLIAVHIGIFNLNKNIRSAGLYLLIITLVKMGLYDIWNITDNAIVRIVAFMFVGSIMIYISSLYKKNNLKLSDDFASEETSTIVNPEKSQSSTINTDLEKIDLGEKTAIIFKFNDGKNIKIRAKNLVKMGKIVIEQSGKTTFEKGELKTTFDYIKANYKSELNKRDYDKIVEIVEKFVKDGGSVEVV